MNIDKNMLSAVGFGIVLGSGVLLVGGLSFLAVDAIGPFPVLFSFFVFGLVLCFLGRK